MTQSDLEALCREWQQILRLQDWDVKVQVVRQWDMQLNGQGEAMVNRQRRLALIRILDEIDYPPGLWPQDQEQTLVHELLHLHFAPFAAEEQDSPEDVAQEQAIHAISQALVELKRRGDMGRREACQTGRGTRMSGGGRSGR